MGSGATETVIFGRRTRVAERSVACAVPSADAAWTVEVVANHSPSPPVTAWLHRYVQVSCGDKLASPFPSPRSTGGASHPGSVTVTWVRGAPPVFVTRIVSGTVEPTCAYRGAVFDTSTDGGQLTVSVTDATSSPCADAGSSEAST